MAGRALTAADRFFMEAVDSVPDDEDQCVDLTVLAKEEAFDAEEASAGAWERAGYGNWRRQTGAGHIVFSFSPAGYAKARAEADRLHATARRRWTWPDLDGTSGWLAAGAFAVALLYSLMMFFWG